MSSYSRLPSNTMYLVCLGLWMPGDDQISTGEEGKHKSINDTVMSRSHRSNRDMAIVKGSGQTCLLAIK